MASDEDLGRNCCEEADAMLMVQVFGRYRFFVFVGNPQPKHLHKHLVFFVPSMFSAPLFL